MVVDEALAMQLKAFADSLKGATGAKYAVVMVGDDDNSLGGIATESGSRETKKRNMAGCTYMMVQTTHCVLQKVTDGKCGVMFMSEGKPKPMAEAKVNSFEEYIDND